MRIPNDPLLPKIYGGPIGDLIKTLTKQWRSLAEQLNGISEGRITNNTNAHTTYPTTGDHTQGDEVKNSNPTELGGAGSKYVIVGWKCVASGSPGTWVQMRTLTGN